MRRSLLGTRIRERRRQKKLSQTALAQKAGISISYMNLIEHNHRDIAGRTLLAIANALDVSAEELSEGADHSLITHLQEAATLDAENQVELARTEEFIGRFPGWAKLTESLYENVQSQNERLQALSDRLGRDPFLADAMHLMLSNITALQSTADILATSDDIPKPVADRFLDNMRVESTRLAETIQNLLAYFDETVSEETKDKQYKSQSGLDRFWETREFYLPEIESSKSAQVDIDAKLSNLNLDKSHDKDEIKQSIQRYIEITQATPLDEFINAAKEESYEPVSLAEHFKLSIADVFFRLAHLPEKFQNEDIPRFGLIECDGSGGVLFRKALPEFSLPRKSSACPLWPLYRAISQPMLPIRTFIEAPTGESLLTYSFAYRPQASNFNLPGTIKSAMIFTADFPLFTTNQVRKTVSSIKVGMNCEVCPRKKCNSRRAKSILNV